MDLFPGLSDPYYRHFGGVAGAILLVMGTILGVLRLIPSTREGARGPWIAYRSWLLMAPVILLALGLGPKVFIIFLGILSIFFVKEFAQATGLYEDWSFVGAVYAGIAFFFTLAFIQWYGMFMAMPLRDTSSSRSFSSPSEISTAGQRASAAACCEARRPEL